jgi:Xaa-Pro aminopeptidase
VSRADRQGAALELALAAGAEVLVCADPANVHWLTGLVVEIETGPNPFAAAPAVLIAAGEPARLLAAEEDLPEDLEVRVEPLAYTGFSTGPLSGIGRARELAAGVIGGRRAAVDSAAARALVTAGTKPADVAAALVEARAVKDSEELEAIRKAIAVTDVGQERARAAVAEGGDELEVLAAARAAMEATAGERLPLGADLVSGPRAAAMGGGPSAHRPAPGELVLCDLAPRVAGTWGDSCATFAVGDPPAAARAAHGRVREALERAIEAVRPGAVAGAIDALTRDGLDYSHHTGHGIGSSFYESPRLVPGADTTLREGMVIALEPAYYDAGFGLRLEHVVRVTADGCEDLSTHRLELE